MNRCVCVVAGILTLGLAGSAQAASKLFVGNLPYGTTSEDVSRLVSGFGPVSSIVVVATDRDGEQTAEATVEFEHRGDVDAAAAALDGTVVGGEPISAKPKEIVVVGSKVKEVIKEAGLRSDGELVQAVNDAVHDLLATAITRAKANGRSTVRPHDL